MRIAALIFLLLATGTALGATQLQIDQITNVIERLCLSGSSYQLKANVGGRIQFFKLLPGAQGGIQVDVKNAAGGVNYLNEQIRLEFDKQTRDCMQPHINRLIDLILDTPSSKSAPQKKATPTPNKQSKPNESSPKTSALSIEGVLPLHVWQKRPGPEKTSFTEHRLGFIAKVQNNRPFAVRVNLATIEGCVPVSLSAGERMLIPGERPLPEPVIIDKAYAEREKTTIQRIKISGIIRKDSNEIPPSGIGYTAILFPLTGGSTGALFHVSETVTTTGRCDAIKRFSPQPSVQQLFKIGPVHYTFPSDIAAGFYTEQLSLSLHFSSEVLRVNPKTFGKLAGITAQNWSSLLLPQMYEVPDDLFAPVDKNREANRESSKIAIEKQLPESPCSNPIAFKQEGFRPTAPPYPAHFLYGTRANFQMAANTENKTCRFRIVADNPIEGGDFGPSSNSGGGRVRDVEVVCDSGSKNIEVKIFGTGPNAFNCIDSIR